MKTLIIAAGEGTRLRPLTYTRPKPMIPILGKPMLEHVILQLKRLGFTEIVLVIGYRKEQIREYFEEGDDLGVSIQYIVQEALSGEADAILLAEPELQSEKRFLMVDSDFYADDEMISNTWATATKHDADVSMALTVVDNPSQFGIVDVDSQNKVKKIIEKPAPGTEPSNLGVSSIYAFSPQIFQSLKKTHDLENAIQDLIDTRNRVYGSPWSGTWRDVGRPWDVLHATDYYLSNTLKGGSQIDESVVVHKQAEIIDPVVIGPNVQIMKGAVVKGPAYIGANCMIGNNSLVRNGTALGNNVEVGYSNEITHSVVFDNAVLSHFVYCGDSVIGEGSHLGAGTKTANVRFDNKTISANVKQQKFDTQMTKLGVIMGDNSHTGINVSVYPGRFIGANSRVGPGVIVRDDIPSNRLVQVTAEQKLDIIELPSPAR